MIRSTIRRLSNHVVDLIAAGEVVERPAAALKELVENALDAGATRLEVALREGGSESIDVTDNGQGITHDELPLAVERHCTSKLQGDDLVHIRTLGFRGEALPSIGASARLSITSRTKDSDTAWCIRVEGGTVHAPTPAPGEIGTRVVVRDLFFATPARRKFLKSARVEGSHAEAVMRRVALSAPHCAISFHMEGREIFNVPAQTLKERVAIMLGVAQDTLLEVDEQRGKMHLSGFVCGPGHTKATGSGQFLLVNDRPVTDPVLRTAVRVAYRSVIEKGRFPVLLLHLHVPLDRVDVNVHPAKTELRFADEGEVRAFVIGAVGRALARGAGEGGGIHADLAMISRSVSPSVETTKPSKKKEEASHIGRVGERGDWDLGFAPSVRRFDASVTSPSFSGLSEASASFGRSVKGMDELVFAHDGGIEDEEAEEVEKPQKIASLGVPIGQIHDTYIVALAPDGDLILVDQHAAHERLTHERLRRRFQGGHVKAQALLLPEVVDLARHEMEALLPYQEELSHFGLEIEPFGEGSVMVRSIPSPLEKSDVEALIRDIAEELAQDPELSARQTDSLDGRFEGVVARMACHGSIRAGRRLKREEMEALLHDMAQNPRANTCPHGRPTWLRLNRDALEKLFGRTK
ncbi:DNA mismatch repair endonuclease MutL [Saccharibacter sp. 17.LH.SD]|uniref:DNA mismatch repair endonuclease MutL n=1 Tax=Saccharibacter sp. 17.LH.SD TaxID=2689393 RepID=UPI00136A4CC6|nr:DNA mismatch repair endonuclease MutL [Saccharibacter sp. 17.LH.SD]